MSKILIAPSILAADFGNLSAATQMINESHADYIHIDIMDGNFVPNISFGFPVTQALYKHAKKPLDFHLMINIPDIKFNCLLKSKKISLKKSIEAPIIIKTLEKPSVNNKT